LEQPSVGTKTRVFAREANIIAAGVAGISIEERLTMNKFQTMIACAVAVSTSATAVLPSYAAAQSQSEIARRQKTKNDWRNFAYAGGALALLGLLNKNSTLTGLGVVGALYSAHRYEQDRKSQSRMQQARAQLFSRSSFTHNGATYVRKTVWKNGKKYYTFVRAR
jgi:hypothetical protein